MRNAGLPSRARIHCLKTETGFTGTRAHAYDANTNRTSDGATSPTLITYTPASNRIATANGLTVTHDAAGNLLADGLYTYTWDEAGRLKTVSKNGTLLATYAYDYRNRRSSKSTTAAAPQGVQAILYHYDQDDHLIGETRSDGTPLRTYIWLAERPITIIEHAAISNPPRSLHLQHDHLGTPRLAKNDAGVIQWRWDSDGYGTSTPTQDPDGDGKLTVINLRFPGQYYDQESGLYYNWNRYYSPRLGRYLSPDPIGIEGGGNGYGYVGGNPMSRIDPLGLASTPGDNSVYPPTMNCSCVLKCMEGPHFLDELCDGKPEKKKDDVCEATPAKKGKKGLPGVCEVATQYVKGMYCTQQCYGFCSGSTSSSPY